MGGSCALGDETEDCLCLFRFQDTVVASYPWRPEEGTMPRIRFTPIPNDPTLIAFEPLTPNPTWPNRSICWLISPADFLVYGIPENRIAKVYAEVRSLDVGTHIDYDI
jgi:hypothetical protein